MNDRMGNARLKIHNRKPEECVVDPGERMNVPEGSTARIFSPDLSVNRMHGA
jgi:hypothetical protein